MDNTNRRDNSTDIINSNNSSYVSGLGLLNKDISNRNFRLENNRLVKYTSYGRKRKNWKSYYRQKSKKFKKPYCQNIDCLSCQDLTIHHKQPLRSDIDITDSNCVTLCLDCHRKIDNLPKNYELLQIDDNPYLYLIIDVEFVGLNKEYVIKN